MDSIDQNKSNDAVLTQVRSGLVKIIPGVQAGFFSV